MEKLTLEHICGYLPYGLKVKSLNSKIDYSGGKEILTINGCYPLYDGSNEITHYTFQEHSTGKTFKEFKPILYPMSDLTKEHNGKVPIVELAKIAFPLERFTVYLDGCINLHYTITFCFSKDFEANFRSNGKPTHINNQLALFQYLYKNKFDIHGLIEKGLAIDVNTLETNPYEL